MDRAFWKGARAAVYSIFLIVGGAFWTIARVHGFAMQPQVYGADVVSVPSEFWAAMLFIPSVTYLMALYINGRRWWTPIVRLVSGLLVALNFSAFVVSAYAAPFGAVVLVWSAAFGAAVVVLASVDAIEASRQWESRK